MHGIAHFLNPRVSPNFAGLLMPDVAKMTEKFDKIRPPIKYGEN
jgi:hypothetical protein